MKRSDIEFADTDIAIVGMAARLPGANTVDEFWSNLKNSVESFEEYTDEELLERGVPAELLNNPDYQKVARPLDDMEMFDPAFFGFTPKEASIMDPQHRHFLEVAWEALEHAGYDPKQYKGSVGVYGGSGHNAYMPYNLFSNPDLMDSIGLFLARHTSNDKDFLTTRVSYCLDLQGPSINVQTACSTSLVAIHLASQALLSGECDMALAGGVTIELPHKVGYLYQEGEILSPDGHCRAFDVNSKGTVFGSGAAQVVLKRMEDALQDGDTIHAVIKGSAINNDGSGKVGYLAPSVDGQSAAITEALALADVDADSITYVETHGTGTPVGDPIEITALTQAYRTQTEAEQFCAIGSVKTNIGHLDTAAGVAGLIKIVQSMKHKQLPASLHYTAPNPAIEFDGSPFYVNAELKEWDSEGPRRAAINSLGVGGTNAHIILEEAPQLDIAEDNNDAKIFCISARSSDAVNQSSARLYQHLNHHPDTNLNDLSHTLMVGRQAQLMRRVVVADSIDSLRTQLSDDNRNGIAIEKSSENTPELYFMFTGQGAQYIQMAHGLYQTESVFKQAMDECANGLDAYLDQNLLQIIFAENNEANSERLKETRYTQPALFAVEYAMAKLFNSWGITAKGMIGHSIGEYVAACLGGLFKLTDALKLVAARGRLMQSMPAGSMLVVQQDEEDLLKHLDQNLDIAAINAPGLCVVSGEDQHIDSYAEKLSGMDIQSTRLHTSHAFHSAMMEPILNEFKQLFNDIEFGQITQAFISNVNGDWATQEQVANADYWAQHLRGTVRYADGMATLMKTDDAVFIECGPGKTLCTFTQTHNDKKPGHHIVQSIRHPKASDNDQHYALLALGKIWASGGIQDWNTFEGDTEATRIPLPTYPFEHQRCWIEPGAGSFALSSDNAAVLNKQSLDNWYYHNSWFNHELELTQQSFAQQTVVCFCNQNDSNQKLLNQLNTLDADVIRVHAGESYKAVSDKEYEIAADSEQDYKLLFNALKQQQVNATHIVHSWTLDEPQANYKNGFDSVFALGKYFAANEPEQATQVSLITNNTHSVCGEVVSTPLNATMAGPIKVMAQEIPTIDTQFIDIDVDNLHDWQRDEALENIGLQILNPSSDEDICFRGNRRFVQQFEPATLDASDKDKIRDGGYYLITGGIDGLSFSLAKHLVDKHQANIIVFNRTALPDENEWDEYLKNGNDQKLIRRINNIRSLQSSGSKILTFNADVSNAQQVNDAVAQAKSQVPHIHGVFHTAGIVDDNLLAFKSLQDCHKVLSPKVDGLLNLDTALADTPLDFMLLFSSTSAHMGLSGQADYTGANAFIDAYADYKRAKDGLRVLSVNWAVWSETGMAADIAIEKGITLGKEENEETPFEHYFYQQRKPVKTAVEEFSSTLSAKTHWIIDEHRSRNKTSLIPGTAYLELARSAFNADEDFKPVTLSDVFFVSPFVIEGKEEKDIRVQIDRTSNRPGFLIQSEFGEENVRGNIEFSDQQAPAALNIEAITERCNESIEERRGSAEHNHLLFGERWRCINNIRFGKKESITELEVMEQYVGELSDYILHPAIMDMATGTSQSLNHDYDAQDDLYIPISYASITVFKPLTQKMYSHVVYTADEGQGSQVSTFDIAITDAQGNILVKVDNFSMKRVDPAVLGELKSSRIDMNPAEPTRSASELFFEMGVKNGITTEEGMQSIDRIINHSKYSQLVVSPIDYTAYLLEARKLRDSGDIDDEDDDDFEGAERPAMSNEYIAPEDDLQKKIFRIWRNTLGIAEIGIDDDFFELGGHSLLLTQVISKLKKALNIDLPLSDLFEEPTILAWSQKIADSDHTQGSALPPVTPVNRQDYKIKRSDLNKAA